MGEYAQAECYFDTVLSSSNPNDEEIACVFYSFGRIHRLKGDFSRALNCFNRAYQLNIGARPKRRASAGKVMNGLGIVYSERGQVLLAEECFQRAMKLYKRTIPKYHVDTAGILINLGAVDCRRGNVRRESCEKYYFLESVDLVRRSIEEISKSE